MAATLVFVHGLESTGQGAKGQYFRKNFPEMIVEDYVGNFAKRMEKLGGILNSKNNLILVGSSFGGLMAAQYAIDNESRIIRLILLAPAMNLPEFHPNAQKPFQAPVIIYHGINDNIVDPYSVKKIAEKAFSQMEHHLVDDDHSLHETFSRLNWKKMLHKESRG
jgi:alpha-beta hydrolase superfamily lysophospholipase